MADDLRQWGAGFSCAPGLRIEAQEKLVALQFAQLQVQLSKIELAVERLEKRLWLTVYGVAAVILAQAAAEMLPRAL